MSRGGISSRPDSILQQSLDDSSRRVYPSTQHHRNWLDSIRAGKECICPAEVGHRSATICHLGNIAYQLKRNLKWDPQNEAFVGDDEANKLVRREPRAKWKLV